MLLDLRNFVKSLGNNVIEEVRPHRIAYAKSLTFRTFLDIQPRKDSLTISLRKSRSESTTDLYQRNLKMNSKVKFGL